jgi:ankyrin repeat protein
VVAFLLSEGPEVNTRDAVNRTPFLVACAKGYLGVVRVLEQHMGGQGLDDADLTGRTGLHYAAERGDEEVAAFLLSKGVQVTRTEEEGRTPLVMASSCGHVGVVRLLVQHMGARGLDGREYMGYTALHCAVEWDREEVVKVLLLAGADPTITDDEGMTPRALAERGCAAVFEVSDMHALMPCPIAHSPRNRDWIGCPLSAE